MIRELIRNHIPVTIIDWHDEYTSLIREFNGIIAVPPTASLKPSQDELSLTWNLLDPRFYSPDVTDEIIEDYIEIVVELLAPRDLMHLSEPMKCGLTEALKLAYKSDLCPTFKDITELFCELPITPQTRDALQHRSKKFSSGTLGSIFCSKTHFDPQSMFTRPMSVRMKHLTGDHKQVVGLLTYFILRQAVSHFKKMGDTNMVRHVIIIDEAPVVLESNPKVESEIVSMLQEVRKFGEGLILVCRNPKISDDIMRETNQKITHQLNVPGDVNYIVKMLDLGDEDRKLLYKLPRGVAFARIAGNPTVLVRVKPG